MLTVLQEKDSKTVEQYYKKAGLTKGENSFMIAAKLGDELLGHCIFDIEKDTVYILDIEPKDDLMLLDGILRSALHVASERFVFKAKYKDDQLGELFERIGFVTSRTYKTIDIDKLFGGCNCGKKP